MPWVRIHPQVPTNQLQLCCSASNQSMSSSQFSTQATAMLVFFLALVSDDVLILEMSARIYGPTSLVRTSSKMVVNHVVSQVAPRHKLDCHSSKSWMVVSQSSRLSRSTLRSTAILTRRQFRIMLGHTKTKTRVTSHDIGRTLLSKRSS